MTEYRRYQGRSYMILNRDLEASGYEYSMLTENRIPGILPFQMSGRDGHLQFWYDISGMQALEDRMKMKRAGSGFLKKFLAAFMETSEHLGEYLLCEDGISFAPEQIFVDFEEIGFAFCYMPFEKTSFAESLRSFMEYFISHMQHDDRKDAQKCYEVYEMCQRDNISIEELLKLLFQENEFFAEEQKGERGDENISSAQTPEKIKPSNKEKSIIKEKRIKKQKKSKKEKILKLENTVWKSSFFQKKKRDPGQYVFEPEACRENNSNQTVFLGSESNQIIGELKYEGIGNAQNFTITAPIFVIGSQREAADGIIANDTVSRIHAKITKEEDGYYLEDMNSTNGTYHNGELLNYKEKVRLEKNDRISFAKEGYRFV